MANSREVLDKNPAPQSKGPMNSRDIVVLCMEYKVLDLLYRDPRRLVGALQKRGDEVSLQDIENTRRSFASSPEEALWIESLEAQIERVLGWLFVVVILALALAVLTGALYLLITQPEQVALGAHLVSGASLILSIAMYGLTIHVAFHLLVLMMIRRSLEEAMNVVLSGLLVLLMLWIKGHAVDTSMQDPWSFLLTFGVALILLAGVWLVKTVFSRRM